MKTGKLDLAGIQKAAKEATIEGLKHCFTYHPPKDDQPARYVSIRDKGKELALLVEKLCPESRERSLAFTRLEEAIMWANAAIARNE